MNVQSAISIAPQAPPPAPVNTSGSAEAAFEDLFKDAMQTAKTNPPVKEKPRQTDKTEESEPVAKTEEDQKAAAKPEETAPEEVKAEEPEPITEEEPDQATMQNLLAATATPIVTPVSDETVITDAESIQISAIAPQQAVQGEVAVQPEPPQAPPVNPVDAAAQETVMTEAAAGTEESAEPKATDSIEFGEVTQEAPETQETPTESKPREIPPDPKAQARFDAMVSKASDELKGMQPQTEQVIETVQETEIKTAEAAPKAAPRPLSEQLDQIKEDAPEPITSVQAETAAVDEITQQIRTQEPQKAEPPEAPTPARQVEFQITERLEEGTREFTMQLSPENLGKITVKLVLEDGKMAVHIAAATQKAADALKKESEGLMASMRLAGIAVDTVNVVPETNSASGHMESPFNMAAGQGQEGNNDQGQQGSQTAGKAFGAANESPEALNHEAQPDRLLDQAV